VLSGGAQTTLHGEYRDAKLGRLPDAELRFPQNYAYRALGNGTCATLAALHLGPALAEIDQGRPVLFDDIQLTPEGVRRGRDFLAWSTIGGVDVSHGKFGVTEAGARRPAIAREVQYIPRFTLLHAVVGVMVERSRGSR
jgi:hypothetical protein